MKSNRPGKPFEAWADHAPPMAWRRKQARKRTSKATEYRMMSAPSTVMKASDGLPQRPWWTVDRD